MKRSTIFIDEDLEADIKHLARVTGKKVSHLIREALKEYVNKSKSKNEHLFVGIGRSGEKDISESYEDRLWDRE
ncbi:MAG: ribbon-helix-helix protein, CopG family [Thermodesulfobacteriota bacterium]